jgi:hypothetical protein
MKVYHCEQRTDEWRRLRLGRLTASNAGDMLAAIKTGEAAARRDLRMRLVCERLIGQPQESGYQSDEMKRGTELEPAAIAAFEAMTGEIVSPVGFVAHDTLMAGCSTDGYIVSLTERLVSVKCPKTSTHIRYLRDGRMPTEYVGQMLCEFWITGAKSYDFVSYDDRLPEALQLFHVRVTRDDAAVAEFAKKAVAFLAEVDAEESALRTLANLPAVLAESVA